MQLEYWRRLPNKEKERLLDYSNLSQQLIGKEGRLVKVLTLDNRRLMFYVARSQGSNPFHVMLNKQFDKQGFPAPKQFKEVKVYNKPSNKWRKLVSGLVYPQKETVVLN